MKGKTLLLYTDGLNEAENKRQEQYGDDRLQMQAKHLFHESAQQTIESLKKDVTLFVDGAEPSDDMTMLCLKLL